MNILLVYAHDEASSLTAAFNNISQEVLTQAGHSVVVSDLYGVGFHSTAERYDFTTLSGQHFNYMNEQQVAAAQDWAYSPDIVEELQKIQTADIILFHFPLWWNAPPAILKGWLDRVLTKGTAWDAEHIFSTGKYRGKIAGVVVTAGDPESYYRMDGVHKATVQQMLYPLLHGTLAYCGFNVLEPFIAHGLTAANEFAIDEQLRAYRAKLEKLETYPHFIYKY
jgi:NAD(P)H dehydrogenase (quinone)